MTINTNLSVEQLVSNLQKSLKNRHNLILKDLKVREILAETLGYKNANTMLGMLEKEKKLSFSNSFGDFSIGDYVVTSCDENNQDLGIGIIEDVLDESKSYRVKLSDQLIIDKSADELNFFDPQSYTDQLSVQNSSRDVVIKCKIMTDDQNVSVSLNIFDYVKFLSEEDLNNLIDNNSCSTESDSVYQFFSYLGCLDPLDVYLNFKNAEEVIEGYSVDIDLDDLKLFRKKYYKNIA